MPMKNPPHPGDFIRTEIVQPAGLSVTAAAAALGVSRPALSSLLNGSADLSGDMALRIEKAFGVKMDTLMRMQSSYDIARTCKREKTIRIRRIHAPADILAPPPAGTAFREIWMPYSGLPSASRSFNSPSPSSRMEASIFDRSPTITQTTLSGFTAVLAASVTAEVPSARIFRAYVW
jgi:addiction module HigA family antidote